MPKIGINMRRFQVYTWGIIFLVCSAFPLQSETGKIAPFVMPSARFAALGGNHPAQADDFYSLFLNPAAFVDVNETSSAAEITAVTYGPVMDIMDHIREWDEKYLPSLDLSDYANIDGFSLGAELGGPLSLGWVGRGWGLGVFSRARSSASVSVDISGGFPEIMLNPFISGELFLTVGHAFRIVKKGSHLFDAGFLGKGFYRGTLNLSSAITDAGDMFKKMERHPFDISIGLGLDLGLRYTFMDDFAAALVCYDVYSPVFITSYPAFNDFYDNGIFLGVSSYDTVKRRLDMGVSYRINTHFIDRFFSRLTVMASYRDFLDIFSEKPRNGALNIGIGAEAVILNALTFRLGMTDLLPAFGFGLDLSFMSLDFSIFGKEIGMSPGSYPVFGMALGLLFRY